jgi:hypothetical protein
MVNKKNIEKLSDKELENYIKQESRFTSLAIKYAYEILKERGRIFSEIESESIQKLIESKSESENKIATNKNNGWDKNLIEDETAIELYTNNLIWVFSVFFGVIFGTVLQILNFSKIKNSKGIFISLIFGISYTIFQVYISNYIQENFSNIFIKGNTLTFLLSGIGALGLFFIRESLFPKNFEYRAKSFIVPLIISILIYIPIIYVMFRGM